MTESFTGPNESLGFEINPSNADEGIFSDPDVNDSGLFPQSGVSWKFNPEFYPDSLTQMKKRKLKRYGSGCEGENVSIKAIKNREFHVSGVLLTSEIDDFHSLTDHHGKVDLISPKAPNGGAECHIKKTELGNQSGWDPHQQERLFEYSIDLVSTGRDEDGEGTNAIVSALLEENQDRADQAQGNLEEKVDIIT